MPTCGGCFAGLPCPLWRESGQEDEQDDEAATEQLEAVVQFLETVPLFRKQLPKADIPVVANAVTMREYQPGDVIIKQGEFRLEFFLIMRGQASVEVDSEVHAILEQGDYWGDGTMVRNRPSAATIRAKLPDEVVSMMERRRRSSWSRFSGGPGQETTVVILALSLREFGDIGLHRKVAFPRRMAIYNGFHKGQTKTWRTASKGGTVTNLPINEQDEDCIVEALTNNVNLQPILQVNVTDLHSKLARLADIVEYEAGEVVVRDGEYSEAVYVIKSGRVKVVPSKHGRVNGRIARKLAAQEAALQKDLMNMTALRANLSPSPSKNGLAKSVSRGSIQDLQNSLVRRRSVPAVSKNGCQKAPELGPGNVFGELSLINNTRRVATFQVACDEAAVLYVIHREDFKRCFYKKGPEYKRCCDLLDDVPLLNSLFRAQRWELARNAYGFENFGANEVVLEEGKQREANMWYVIASGSAIMTSQGCSIQVTLQRGDTFGQRCLLLRQSESEVSVRAGKEGMVCLCIQGELLQNLVLSSPDLQRITASDVVEYLHDMDSLTQRRREPLTMASSFCVDPDNLRTVAYLGRGAFGFVVLQEDEATGAQYALKRVSKGLIQEREAERHVCKERDLMSLLNCLFVVRLHTTWRDDQFVYMIEDAMLGGSLDDLRSNRPEVFEEDSPPGSTAAFYAACVIEALNYLHDLHIVYRDLKPENVLLDRTGYAKVCDMGFARFIVGRTYTFCGTPDYIAPEVVDQTKRARGYSFAVDWWSLGAMVFELLVGHTPFEVEPGEEGEIDWQAVLAQMNNTKGIVLRNMPQRLPRAASDFVRRLMHVDPKSRLGNEGAMEVRDHDWFRTVDFFSLRERASAVPFVPDAFVPVSSAPELWDKMGRPVEAVLTEHVGKRLMPGGERFSKNLTIEQAKATCRQRALKEYSEGRADWCMSFTCQPPCDPTDKTMVTFQAHCDLQDSPGWVTYRCHPDLYEKWKGYGNEYWNWDNDFELSPGVMPTRQKLRHAKTFNNRPDEVPLRRMTSDDAGAIRRAASDSHLMEIRMKSLASTSDV